MANISPANGPSVSEVIKHDHAELKDFYNNILGAQDGDAKVRWQNQFTWELARHAIAEELVVYPAMEKHMGDQGKQAADHDREEHNKVIFATACAW
jgi:hemerythrin superfamily protein